MHRRCPICDLETAEPFCPDDQIATLIVDAPEADASSVVVGQVIGGRYRIETRIGRGGFGAVFSARHTGTGQNVAVKVLSHAPDSEVVVRRFFLEARVTAGLKHPNTIRVFDFGQDESGLLYIAMERLVGRTLRREIKMRKAEDRPFKQSEIIRIGVDITKSLSEAHAAGLVHRDLKPDNVFLHEVEGNDPVVKVLDFGIVRMADSTLTMGSDSGIPGTPAYMSPEQAKQASAVDGRSDLYALGVILYQLVCGSVPFKGETVLETIYMHAEALPPSLAERARSPISPALVSLVHQCLAKVPEDRPETAAEMRQALEDVADSTASIHPDELGVSETMAVPSSIHMTQAPRLPLLWIVVALSLGSALGGVVLLALWDRPERERVEVVAQPPPPSPPISPPPPPVLHDQPEAPPPPPPPKKRRRKKRPRPEGDGVLGEKI